MAKKRLLSPFKPPARPPLGEEPASKPTPPKKAKRRRKTIVRYSAMEYPKRTGSGTIVAIRTKKKVKGVKTAAIVHSQLFGDSLAVPKTPLREAFKGVEGNREIYKVIRHSVNGSPMGIETPGGTVLWRKFKYGSALAIFSDDIKAPYTEPLPLKKLEADEALSSSEPHKSVEENLSDSKFISVVVTPELISKTKREIKNKGGHRNQNKVLGGKATEYAQATKGFREDLKWEWLHLVAHFILGEKSQSERNLGAGTTHSNTNMIFIENQLPLISKAYPEGFKLEVTGYCVNIPSKDEEKDDINTQIFSTIEYVIVTPDFALKLNFNAQAADKPDFAIYEYFSKLIQTVLKVTQEKRDERKRDSLETKPDVTTPPPVKRKLDFGASSPPSSPPKTFPSFQSKGIFTASSEKILIDEKDEDELAKKLIAVKLNPK